jgi:hypothetical protein
MTGKAKARGGVRESTNGAAGGWRTRLEDGDWKEYITREGLANTNARGARQLLESILDLHAHSAPRGTKGGGGGGTSADTQRQLDAGVDPLWPAGEVPSADWALVGIPASGVRLRRTTQLAALAPPSCCLALPSCLLSSVLVVRRLAGPGG